jgi:hypothetical protein
LFKECRQERERGAGFLNLRKKFYNINMMLTKILNNVFSVLKPREKDIIFRRFGFEGEEETLEELAQDYNLTRERIRQIQEKTLEKIIPALKSNPETDWLIEKSKKFLKPIGVCREQTFLNLVQREFNFNYQEIKIFKFFTIFSQKIIFYQEDEDVYGFYALEEKVLKICRHLLKKIYLHLLETKKLYSEDELLNLTLKEIKRHLGIQPKLQDVLDFLKILKNLGKNPFNFWGLKSNNFITPRCLKDKIIFIFKLEKKPLHFREIYQKLYELSKIEDESIHYFWHRNYNVNSIKNELIRHPDFVLIKRGVYFFAK